MRNAPTIRRARALPALTALLLGALLALALGGCAGLGGDPIQALRVNDQSVSLAMFQRLVEIQKLGAANQGQTTAWQTPDGRANLASAQSNAYQFLEDVVLIHQDAARQHLTASNSDVLQQATALSDNINGSLAQSPNSASLKLLADAAKAAVTIAKQQKPSLGDLLERRASMSEAVLVYAFQNADVKVLFAKGTVPAAHVRLIEVPTLKAANDLKAQLEAKKVDFATYAKAHSLDTGTGAKGGEFGTFRVGEISQQTPELDRAVFGPGARYTAGTQYVVAKLTAGNAVVAEVTQRSNVPLAAITDQQTQNSVFGGWLDIVARPGAQIEHDVASA
ncbi:MAG TPA: peptidylprolyl isomerase [Ktedonobacterales bacterium]|nr:peptidylprolyl isomerase [Ktedonobacterales bacterium]